MNLLGFALPSNLVREAWFHGREQCYAPLLDAIAPGNFPGEVFFGNLWTAQILNRASAVLKTFISGIANASGQLLGELPEVLDQDVAAAQINLEHLRVEKHSQCASQS